MIDVAIVGAGPAGSTLAALLAARGCSVMLLDRDTFPRDKLCGEFLSYDALPVADRFGIDLSSTPRIARCRIVARHRTYEFPFPHAARGVSRLMLDDLLLRAAQRAGTEVRTGTPVAALSAGHVEAAGEQVRARVVVGAWGRWGRFDTQLRRGFVRDRSHRNFGFKRHYRPPSASDRDLVSLYPFRRGYLGVSAVEGGRINICGLVHASRLAGHKGRWDGFVEEIRREEPHLDALFGAHEADQPEFLSSDPVIFRARSAVEAGVFMIGDASGIVDPLTGNGMAMAMQSALLAAPFVLSALSGRRADAERAYAARHRQFFAARISWSRRVAYLLYRPRLLDAALAAARQSTGPFLLRSTRAGDEQVARLQQAWQ